MKRIAAFVCFGFILGCATVPPPDPQAVADKPAAVKGNNAFALELYARLPREENLFFSAYSISTALAMTYSGARGQTAEEMAKTLHFTLDQDRLHPALAAVMYDLNGDGSARGYQLSTANALWGQKGLGFLPEFLQVTRKNYGAGLQEVDYAADPEKARQTINRWVERQTRDKIKELLVPGIIDGSTQLVLTNAIYFKGSWASPFEKAQTKDEDFHVSAQRKVPVRLMHKTKAFHYLQEDSFQVLEMPYTGDDLSMVVFLPKKVDGLAEFEQSLTAGLLEECLKKLSAQQVIVSLPRFEMTTAFSLKKILPQMGMPSAFTLAADFSGMTGHKDLAIDDVIHKAFVDVNEEGTEAAAATAVVMFTAGAVVEVAPPPVFRADHPFLFLIRDRRTDSILFLGRVMEPGK